MSTVGLIQLIYQQQWPTHPAVRQEGKLGVGAVAPSLVVKTAGRFCLHSAMYYRFQSLFLYSIAFHFLLYAGATAMENDGTNRPGNGIGLESDSTEQKAVLPVLPD